MALVSAAGLLSGCLGGGGGASASGRNAPTYDVGGTVSGLSAAGAAEATLVLGNGLDTFELRVAGNSGNVVQDRAFVIASLPEGASYDIQVISQPSGTACTVLNGRGAVGQADITGVQVICVKRQGLHLLAGALPHYGALDGYSSAAGFANLNGLSVDTAGNAYVSDGHAVRKVLPSGVVTTLAGIVQVSGLANGSGAQARFNSPAGVAVDAQGSVYVADTGNQLIRKVSPQGLVETVTLNQAQVAALMVGHSGECFICGELGIDASGNLYAATRNSTAVARLSPQGDVNLVAGSAGADSHVMAVSPAGVVYVLNNTGTWLSRIDPATGQLTTLPRVGSGLNSHYVSHIAMASESALVVAGNTSNGSSRQLARVSTDGVIEVLTSYSGLERGSAWLGPVAMTSGGRLLFIDTQDLNLLSWAAATGNALLAGAERGQGYLDATGEAARFGEPGIVAVGRSAAAPIYVADSRNSAIRRIDAQGRVTSLVGTGQYTPNVLSYSLMGVAVDTQDRVHVCRASRWDRYAADGSSTRLAASCNATRFFADGAGRLVSYTAACLTRHDEDSTVLSQVCTAGAGQPTSNAQLTSLDSAAPLADGALAVVDGTQLKQLRFAANGSVTVTNLATLPAAGIRLYGDGTGTLVAVTSGGVELLYGTNYASRATVLELGNRTVTGELPTTIAAVSDVGFRGRQLILTSGLAVYALDL
jgi:sugar lactone lactonase YvrE